MPTTSAWEQAIVALEGVHLPRMSGRPLTLKVNKMQKPITEKYTDTKTTCTSFPLGEKLSFSAAIIKSYTYISKHKC